MIVVKDPYPYLYLGIWLKSDCNPRTAISFLVRTTDFREKIKGTVRVMDRVMAV